MSTALEDILKPAMQLSEADRLLLATKLLDAVSQDLPGWSLDDPALIDELDSCATDGSPSIPRDSVKAKLRADREA